eukprot:133464-Alexandrium_andersonii.AAC.1
MLNDCYDVGPGRTAVEIHEISVLRIRADLMTWYKSQPPTITKVEDLTLSMLGTATQPKLSLKGSETKHIC